MKFPTFLKNQKQSNFFFFLLSHCPLRSFTVTGISMLPTYKEHDKLLVGTFYYWFFTPKTGDCVVLTHPKTKQKIVKRITAIDRKNIFVLGDNTHESTDSRTFGFITKKNIIGKVIYPV